MEITYKLKISGKNTTEVLSKAEKILNLALSLENIVLVRENWCDNCKTPADRYSVENGKCNICGADLDR